MKVTCQINSAEVKKIPQQEKRSEKGKEKLRYYFIG